MIEIKKIEDLLYGYNYQVSLYLYGPIDHEIGLVEALKSVVSPDCEICEVNPVSSAVATSEILSSVLYEGDSVSGPIDLVSKRIEVTELINRVIQRAGIEQADFISQFMLRSGHPAYPVFWDFAFDIHSKGKRWIFIGSSSD